ncbi:hypothetical protein NPIL_696271 [Nephila pilipes]|uniref:Uncharacterized protein n=1 Tax=Nephila pilipes TaxID=299642 RepID=A0A8X6MI78_NEPPI|nr:hypothetical protein NPIL_696271 [Nephila pilipes]
MMFGGHHDQWPIIRMSMKMISSSIQQWMSGFCRLIASDWKITNAIYGVLEFFMDQPELSSRRFQDVVRLKVWFYLAWIWLDSFEIFYSIYERYTLMASRIKEPNMVNSSGSPV